MLLNAESDNGVPPDADPFSSKPLIAAALPCDMITVDNAKKSVLSFILLLFDGLAVYREYMYNVYVGLLFGSSFFGTVTDIGLPLFDGFIIIFPLPPPIGTSVTVSSAPGADTDILGSPDPFAPIAYPQ